MLAYTEDWIRNRERPGVESGSEGWEGGGDEKPQGTPPPVPTPASRPLLAGPRRAPQRGRGVGPPPARIQSPRGSSVPPVPAGLLRIRRAGPGGSPPLWRTRPLTFTFPASRRPSYPQRHQTAPPREGREEEGGRSRHQPPHVHRPGPGQSVDSELRRLDPITPYGPVGLPAQRPERRLKRARSPPGHPKPMTQASGLPLHHGGCSSAGRPSGRGGRGLGLSRRPRKQGRGLEVPAFSFIAPEPDPKAPASSVIPACAL